LIEWFSNESETQLDICSLKVKRFQTIFGGIML